MFLKLCSAEPKGSAEPCLGFRGMTAALFILCTLQANLPQRGSAVRVHNIAQCTLYIVWQRILYRREDKTTVYRCNGLKWCVH